MSRSRPSAPTPGTTWDDDRGWTHRVVDADGVALHYVAAGDPADPPLVALHGFPECWWAWRRHIDRLADRFRLLVPDLRGYNLSAAPAGVDAYRPEALVGDVRALLERAGHERAALLGHDWGGVVVLETALRRPDLVDGLVVCNAPHPRALREQFTLRQALRSWYVALFGLPRLPERLLSWNDFAALERGLREGADGVFTDADLDVYRASWRREGTPTAMLHYYRAFARTAPRRLRAPNGSLDAETLVLWGEDDPALGPSVPAALRAAGDDVTVRRYATGHWPHAARPERSADDIASFLAP